MQSLSFSARRSLSASPRSQHTGADERAGENDDERAAFVGLVSPIASARFPVAPVTGMLSGRSLRMRLRAFKFGDHLIPTQLNALVVLPSGSELVTTKAMVLAALYPGLDLTAIDFTNVRLLLLPDGEEVASASFLMPDDRVVVLLRAAPLAKRSLCDLKTVLGVLAETVKTVKLLPFSAAAAAEETRRCAQLRNDLALQVMHDRDSHHKSHGPHHRNGGRGKGGAATVTTDGSVGGKSSQIRKDRNARWRRVVRKLVLISRFQLTAERKKEIEETVVMQRDPSTLGSTFGLDDEHLRESSDRYMNERRLKIADEVLPWYVSKPTSRWRIAWDVVLLCLVIYLALMLPISVGFNMPPTFVRRDRDDRPPRVAPLN